MRKGKKRGSEKAYALDSAESGVRASHMRAGEPRKKYQFWKRR